MVEKIITKEILPEIAPEGKKDELVQQSYNQQHPADARPGHFIILGEELEFGGACGDTPKEYERLLQVGPRARKNPDPRKRSAKSRFQDY